MPSPKPLPRTLPDWIRQLDGVRLPVELASHERIRKALGSSRNSLRDIAELIQASPSVALELIREANRSSTALDNPAESLEVALNRLGLKRSEELLARLPALPADRIPAALRQMQSISQHAMQQANGLFAARLARLWQEIQCTSLLFLAPLWPLLTLHPQLFDAWERRVLAHGEVASKVELDLLGVPLLKLCLALAEHWRMPEWIVQGYRLLNNERRFLVKALHIARDLESPLHQQQALDADPALRRCLTQPANTIVLANGLALSAHDNWSCLHSLRWQRLTALYLQVPLGDLQQQIHQHAAQSARAHLQPGLWHPALALLWPWAARRFHVSDVPPPPPASALNEWRQYCSLLLKEPSAFANVVQLTACARDALHACGLSRVLVMLADRTQGRLVAQQTLGLPKEAGTLTLDPAQSQVIRRLLEQPGQLRLTPANMAQFSAHLPGYVKSLFPSEHLLLRSIASNGRVVMLVIADQQGHAFSEVGLQAFGKTVQCIERALTGFARRGR
ncbi:HDOD domain-containing protein [Pseudomonas sp. RIT-PI-AD]|uniref:HDOD domain-containing protein n=1 Tax=Pseudomonas sp. RIT-PI-AD TaxID=3035294 RepID=UPI0021DAF4AE|nr:HDOD domain-containing protein [Pseudomonas sp. RIT-PI-AD]